MLIFLVILFFGCSDASSDDPLVLTAQGIIRGYKASSRSGRNFLAFTGIPFAKPPVGELRFKTAERADPWDGVFDATKDPPFCLQSILILPGKPIVGSEDCLYLSVYTHNISGNAPVLFHIHGGAFQLGTSKLSGPSYLMDEDLVIVNINYRVAILGFLSFENSEMPGNMGLKDQLMALRWVKENIAKFGGDPNRVTIMGESAGGASVYHHIVSPLSKGLFHQGIAESGTSYALWALSPPGVAKSNAEKLMKLLGCPTKLDEAMPCIMKKDGRKIVSKIRDFIEFQVDPVLIFGPVLEKEGPDAFLVGPPSEWKHNPVPLFMGMTSAEGLMRTIKLLKGHREWEKLTHDFDRVAPISLMYNSSSTEPDHVTKKIREYYLTDGEITMKDWVNLTTIYTDCWFTTPVIDGANKHKGKVYFYYFDYIWKGSTFQHTDANLVFGSSHVDEMKFLWELEIPFIEKIEGDILVSHSQNMVKIVSSFAANGTPSMPNTKTEWKEWTPENNYYVHIDRTGFHLRKGLAEDRYNFWKSLNFRDKFDKQESTNNYEYDYGEYTLKPPSNSSIPSTGFKPEGSNTTETTLVGSSNSSLESGSTNNSSLPETDTGVKEETSPQPTSSKPPRRCGAGFYRDDAGRCRRLRRPINKLSGLLQQAKDRISGK